MTDEKTVKPPKRGPVASRYQVNKNALYWLRPAKEPGGSPVPVMVATFDAVIIEEDTLDDGAGKTLTYLLDVTAADGRKGQIRVTPEQFAHPQIWAAKAVGTSAIVLPGLSAADHVRTAVLARAEPQRRTVYQHTGWREIRGRHVYLTASGAIGTDGLDTSVTVDLGSLSGYALPGPPGRKQLQAAIRASLALLDVAPDSVTVPLLGSVYRAPLPVPPDCSLWLNGETGTFKTTLTVLAQQHWGHGLDDSRIPGHWTSTANALESQAHKLDGAIFVIDDYAPSVTSQDARKRAETVERTLRSSANRGGRDRLRADGTEWAAKVPRAQIITSAEDLPPANASLRIRTMIDQLDRGAVSTHRLTEAQQQAGLLSGAMSGYVQYLARQWGTNYPERLTDGRNELRELAKSEGHPRTALNVASFGIGWATWLNFAEASGALSSAEHEKYWHRAWKALCDLGADQDKYRRDASPVQVYLRSLAALISSGHAHLSPKQSKAHPDDPATWGWRKHPTFADWQPQGERIGWVHGEDVFLHPETAYRAARRFAESSGEVFSVSEPGLTMALGKSGLLASTGEDGHALPKVRVGKQRPRVVHLTATRFFEGGRS